MDYYEKWVISESNAAELSRRLLNTVRPQLKLKVKRLNEKAKLPQFQTVDAAGFDLHAAERANIRELERELVGTGLAMEIPDGYVGLIFPRSGNAIHRGVNLINGVGVIDSDYRGEIKVGLYNTSTVDFEVNVGDRIAQMVIVPYERMIITEVNELNATARGTKGFGSTGV